MIPVLGAEDAGSIASLVTSMKSGFSDIAGDMLTAIGGIVPVVLPVMGGIAVIGLGIKVFRKVAK